jgi:hypothetical protein
VQLEEVYVEGEEFSFEEVLAKKRGVYGIRPTEGMFSPMFRREGSVAEGTTSREDNVTTSSEEDDVVYMPLRGLSLLRLLIQTRTPLHENPSINVPPRQSTRKPH